MSSISRFDLASRTVSFAWDELPATHRALLENIGADQRQVGVEPLGSVVNRLRVSLGQPELQPGVELDLDEAIGVWLPNLRVVLLNVAHPSLEGLDDRSFATMVAEIAWHEWGHALSIDRASKEDVRNWREYLAMAPSGIAERIRLAKYRQGEITHEIIAGTYAALMSRRSAGGTGDPEWLHPEIQALMARVTQWPG